ncbi:MAG: hypothetical protein WCB49_07510 [Gammaproteobacteria bacterium]
MANMQDMDAQVVPAPGVEEIEREQYKARLVAWMAGCARGDATALEYLCVGLSPQLFGLLLRILQRRDLAEEAVQDTFVSVWRSALSLLAARPPVCRPARWSIRH